MSKEPQTDVQAEVQAFDVIIAGGGLAGALTALSLADLCANDGAALRIAIIEAQPIHQQPALTFDDRVLALAHGSAQYLQQLAVWPLLKPDATAIVDIHVSDRGHYGKARLQAKDYRVSALGYVIELSLLGKALLTRVDEKSNIHWFCPDRIQSIDWQPAQVHLTLASGQGLTAKLLLGCDGAQSQCRQLAHIASDARDYQQSAVIANVRTEQPHRGKAFERFTEFGPIAMLPLSQNRCSLVWTLTPERANDAMALSDEAFKRQLLQAFGSWLGEITEVGKRSLFPLQLLRAEQLVYHRMALLGNAAHTIHPIAGQGFNLGLRDVQQMAELVANALAHGEDIGEFRALSRFAEQRLRDHDAIVGLTDSLVTLFSNELPPLVAGRNIGLKILNYVAPLKRMLAEKTMGH